MQVAQDMDGEGTYDHWGTAVALSADGNRVIGGAPFNNGGGLYAGQARVYDLVGGMWMQVGDDIDGEADGDLSGSSVALSADGNRIAMGAVYNDGILPDTGQVRVYAAAVGEPSLHAGDLDAATKDAGRRWAVRVTVTVHDAAELPVEGVRVSFLVAGRATRSCVTGSAGACTLRLFAPDSAASVEVRVTNMILNGYSYDSSRNHDPDDDSDGTVIVANQP